MVLKLCSRCKKRVAVIYMQRIENGNTTNEGLCLKCAREMGLKPVDDILERMGITPEEFDAMSDEISGLVPTETGDSTENEGRAPSLNLGPLFASQEGLNLPDNIRKDKQQSLGDSVSPILRVVVSLFFHRVWTINLSQLVQRTLNCLRHANIHFQRWQDFLIFLPSNSLI